MFRKKTFVKVPKNLFSESFKRLPLAKKIEIRRRLEREPKLFCSHAEKLCEKLDDLINKIHKKAAPAKQIHSLANQLNELRGEKHVLEYHVEKFCEFATNHFVDFVPFYKSEGTFGNPVEERIHAANKLLKHFDVYYDIASRELEYL